jgi:FtsZ-interacting cell division protein YlmF
MRIFDYMNGVSYIMKAYVSKVRDNLILYTPETVEVERQKRKASLWNHR